MNFFFFHRRIIVCIIFILVYITFSKKQQTEMRIMKKKSGCNAAAKLKISILIKCTSSKIRFFSSRIYVYSRVRFEEE